VADPIPLALALLVRDGSALLVHRHPARRWYPDCWDLVGGHVEPGEQPVDALVRECREELAVLVHDARPMPLAYDDPALDIHAYLVTRWDGEPANAAPEEHDDVRWFRVGDLADVALAHPASRASIVDAVETSVGDARP
jgi:mutator protein MutT